MKTSACGCFDNFYYWITLTRAGMSRQHLRYVSPSEGGVAFVSISLRVGDMAYVLQCQKRRHCLCESQSIPVKMVWPSCVSPRAECRVFTFDSPSEEGVAYVLQSQLRTCGLCTSVSVKGVWTLCLSVRAKELWLPPVNPSEGGIAFVSVSHKEVGVALIPLYNILQCNNDWHTQSSHCI